MMLMIAGLLASLAIAAQGMAQTKFIYVNHHAHSWFSAELYCWHVFGSHLASVHSPEELSLLVKLYRANKGGGGSHSEAWIGLHKTHEGSWKNADGSPAKFFNWHKDERETKGEHAVSIGRFLNDRSRFSRRPKRGEFGKKFTCNHPLRFEKTSAPCYKERMAHAACLISCKEDSVCKDKTCKKPKCKEARRLKSDGNGNGGIPGLDNKNGVVNYYLDYASGQAPKMFEDNKNLPGKYAESYGAMSSDYLKQNPNVASGLLKMLAELQKGTLHDSNWSKYPEMYSSPWLDALKTLRDSLPESQRNTELYSLLANATELTEGNRKWLGAPGQNYLRDAGGIVDQHKGMVDQLAGDYGKHAGDLPTTYKGQMDEIMKFAKMVAGLPANYRGYANSYPDHYAKTMADMPYFRNMPGLMGFMRSANSIPYGADRNFSIPNSKPMFSLRLALLLPLLLLFVVRW